MKKLIKSANVGIDTELNQIIDNVIEECQSCKLYKRPNARPVVGFSKATDFNETVSMDLHQISSNMWYLHMIDEFTRYSNAVIINDKKMAARAFLTDWIKHYGRPKKVYSDNGGEFIGQEIHNICNHFEIEISTTPSFAPASNGLCERHNQILTRMMELIMHDLNCTYDVALAWAVCAKNTMINVHGFSSAQLVFGKNATFASTVTSGLPGLESFPESGKTGLNIAALYAGRRAFSVVESDEKIKRALRKQTRVASSLSYQPGRMVYYRRDTSSKWKGPAKILAVDGPVHWLRHGSYAIKAHSKDLQYVDSVQPDKDKNHKQNESLSSNSCALKEPQPSYIDLDNADSSGDDEQITNSSSSSSHQDQTTSLGNTASNPVTVNVESSPHPTTQTAEDFGSLETGLKLKRNQIVSFDKSGKQYKAIVLRRAGKASGKYKNEFNVEYMKPDNIMGQKGAVNFETVSNLTVNNQVSSSQDSTEIITAEIDNAVAEEILEVHDLNMAAAKESELYNWKRNNVYTEVTYSGQKLVSLKWVHTVKEMPNGDIKAKARLVARGFEEDTRNIEKESPTCSKEALRLILSIIASKRWKLNSIDIKAAFLQGDDITRNVFVRPPPEANCAPGVVWLLKRCVYGLTDASLKWYMRVKKVMIGEGAEMSSLDPSVFIWRKNSDVVGILAIHVDDFLWSGNTYFCKIIDQLRLKFEVGKEEESSFKYLGLKLNHFSDKIILDQSEYVDKIKPVVISSNQGVQDTSSLSDHAKDQLRSRIGQLLWLNNQTRPDISFEVCSLAANFKNASNKDVLLLNKTIKKVHEFPAHINFFNLGKAKKIVVFTDASLGNLPDGGSQGAYLIFLVGENGKSNLVCWQSKRLKRVARSSLTAEAIGMSDALDAAIYTAALYSDMMLGKSDKLLPIEVMTDNRSLIDNISSKKLVTEKRLRIELSAIKEVLSDQTQNRVIWVPTKKQLADVLTKHGPSVLPLLSAIESGTLLN